MKFGRVCCAFGRADQHCGEAGCRHARIYVSNTLIPIGLRTFPAMAVRGGWLGPRFIYQLLSAHELGWKGKAL